MPDIQRGAVADILSSGKGVISTTSYNALGNTGKESTSLVDLASSLGGFQFGDSMRLANCLMPASGMNPDLKILVVLRMMRRDDFVPALPPRSCEVVIGSYEIPSHQTLTEALGQASDHLSSFDDTVCYDRKLQVIVRYVSTSEIPYLPPDCQEVVIQNIQVDNIVQFFVDLLLATLAGSNISMVAN